MSITKSVFGDDANGVQVDSYTIKNDRGLSAELLTMGGIVRKICVPDKNGNILDVVLGCDSISDYYDSPYFGAIVGRVANRIENGKYALDGINYQLNCNSSGHHLHGGDVGLDKRIWQVVDYEPNSCEINMKYTSPDGEENYPGELKLTLTYTLEPDGLRISYSAISDKKTIINLSNHSYFNLNGHESGNIDEHIITIKANEFSPTDGDLIPTGEALLVDGTAFDFRKPKSVKQGILEGKNDAQMQYPAMNGAYDTNFILDKKPGEFDEIASVYSEKSGIFMSVETDQDCVQLYTGNGLDAVKGKSGAAYGERGGLCLETQDAPDSINKSKNSKSILNAGEEYKTQTLYKFSIKK